MAVGGTPLEGALFADLLGRCQSLDFRHYRVEPGIAVQRLQVLVGRQLLAPSKPMI